MRSLMKKDGIFGSLIELEKIFIVIVIVRQLWRKVYYVHNGLLGQLR